MTRLGDALAQPGAAVTARFHAPGTSVALPALAAASMFGDRLNALRGRCVLLATTAQLGTAVALLELDGVARRMVLCTPDLGARQLANVAAAAGADAIVTDGDSPDAAYPVRDVFRLSPQPQTPPPPEPQPASTARSPSETTETTETTEWILLTSGTTGTPKLVLHTLASLAGAQLRGPPLPATASTAGRPVWSTFYDIRRYGGLQIYLRAVLGGCSLVLSSPAESADEFLVRAAAAGVTHISGTPSHWRRALMSGALRSLHPDYVRLSGEVADQPLLDALRTACPTARIAHAFASTEAGVAFDVEDGLAGFPAALLEPRDGNVELKIEAGTLRIRSGRIASRYLGEAQAELAAADGFVDTGDVLELVEGRYHFRGRRDGVINVGGLKVHPEEVEAVLNADPRVRMSLVHPRRNPITGSLVVADIVLTERPGTAGDPGAVECVKGELLTACRRALPAHKVPAMLRVVSALELTAAGKLVRPGA